MLSACEMLTLPGFHILDIQCEPEAGVVNLTACVSSKSACCPDCHTRSERVHSQYIRRPQDLPIQEKAVRLHLQVRRFFCQNPGCVRKTFAEQVPDFLRRYARLSNRVVERLVAIALSGGCEGGARLSKREGTGDQRR
jgi:transposase